MNIIKLQDQLKGLPDQTLAGYVQNPTGEVPTYLALSELQRRKTMREKYQKEQTPQTTVAEDLAAPPPMEQGIAAMAPQQAPVEEQGVASLPTGDMYDEQNFASGGIVAFAKGGTADEYGIEMPVVPAWDDLKMEQFNAMQQYGVDPEFYAKQAKILQEERDALKGEKSNAGWMALTRAGLGMAAGTSPYALKNISEGAIQGVTQYGADVKDIKTQDRLLKQADMKLSEAQNAQNRGDAQGALKAMEERKNLLLNAQIEKAKIGATIAKTTSSNKRDLFNKARDNAQNAMRDQYGTGGLSAAPFFGDEAKWNAELDRKIDKELKFLASEYNIDPSEIKSISSPAATTTTTTAKPAATTNTAKPAASSTPATKPKPTQADIDYVTAHPELRDKFKARFGIDAPSLVNQIPR
jgi:hypothetical protein